MDSLLITLITSSALVPLIIATIAPFQPLADLLVRIVYSSPLERDVSSKLRYLPI